MSKIPIAKGGFRSYVSRNHEKSSGIEHNEQKYADRIRNKENMSDDDGQSTSTNSFSLKNPIPTQEDYARYDADRRFRERARDVRVAQRSEENSARSTMSPLRMTPERHSGGSSEQYYTPSRTSGGVEQFVTPETSKKERRSSERREGVDESMNSTLETTPTSRKSIRSSMDEHRAYSDCLGRQLHRNFQKMEELILKGRPPRQARHEAILEATEDSPRRAHRRTADEMRSTILATRSSSQPPPLETLKSIAPRVLSPTPNSLEKKETPIRQMSYVDAVIATHQMHLHYAEVTAPSIEKQLTKLESIRLLQNLAALSKPKEEVIPKKRRMAGGSGSDPRGAFAELVHESDEQTAMKWVKIREIKLRINQICEVQAATHKLLSKAPFDRNPEDERLLSSLDHWMSLPFSEFDKQTSRQSAIMMKKMRKAMEMFKKVTKMTETKFMNRSMNSRRSSSVMRINPLEHPVTYQIPVMPPPCLAYPRQMKEASSQVTARLSNERMPVPVPRPQGIERLDFAPLQSQNVHIPAVENQAVQVPDSPEVEAPEVPENVEAPEVAPILDAVEVAEAPEVSEEETTPRPIALPPPLDLAGINDMLNNIVLNKDESLETLDAFKTEIKFPPSPPTPPPPPQVIIPNNPDSARSARSSMDPESMRRLSSGVAHYLKKYLREQEGRSAEEDSASSDEKIIVTLTTPTTPTDSSSSVGWSLADMEYNVYQKELDALDATHYEHEKEEEELRHLRAVGAETPTREIKEERPTTPEPVTPRIEEEVTVKTPELKGQEEEEDDAEKTLSPNEVSASESEDSEGDETKKFVVQDEFEETFEDEVARIEGKKRVEKKPEVPSEPPSYQEATNDSFGADDSGFLLDNRPPPILKSIFDKNSPKAKAPPPPRPPPPVFNDRADTPRIAAEEPTPIGDITNNSTLQGLDMEEYCQNDFLVDIAPIMVGKAIEFQDKLRGVDWIEAQSIWAPPTFVDLQMDFYDHFDYFDSFSMLIWGGVVDLFNEKYAKFGTKMSAAQEKKFEAEVWEMLQDEYGAASKNKEWCQEIKLSKKLEGRMPFELEYRFDVRRALSESDKKFYKWQQVQMMVFAERYPRAELEDALNEIYVAEKEKLALDITRKESDEFEREVSSSQSTSTTTTGRSYEVGVSDV